MHRRRNAQWSTLPDCCGFPGRAAGQDQEKESARKLGYRATGQGYRRHRVYKRPKTICSFTHEAGAVWLRAQVCIMKLYGRFSSAETWPGTEQRQSRTRSAAETTSGPASARVRRVHAHGFRALHAHGPRPRAIHALSSFRQTPFPHSTNRNPRLPPRQTSTALYLFRCTNPASAAAQNDQSHGYAMHAAVSSTPHSGGLVFMASSASSTSWRSLSWAPCWTSARSFSVALRVLPCCISRRAKLSSASAMNTGWP